MDPHWLGITEVDTDQAIQQRPHGYVVDATGQYHPVIRRTNRSVLDISLYLTMSLIQDTMKHHALSIVLRCIHTTDTEYTSIHHLL